MGKSNKKKQTIGYVYAIYGGALKAGVVKVGHTDTHPETLFEDLKNSYGTDLKCSFAKTPTPEEHFDELLEILVEKDYGSSNGLFHNVTVTSITTEVKKVTGAKQMSRLVSEAKEETPKKASTGSSKTTSKGTTEKKDASDKKGKKGKKAAVVVVDDNDESEVESEDEAVSDEEVHNAVSENDESEEEEEQKEEVKVVNKKNNKKRGGKNKKGRGKSA